MSLFVSIILANVVQIFTTDDYGAFHFGGFNHASQNPAAYGDIASEGTFLVNVCSIYGLGWGSKAQTNVLVPTTALILRDDSFVVQEDGFLFWE